MKAALGWAAIGLLIILMAIPLVLVFAREIGRTICRKKYRPGSALGRYEGVEFRKARRTLSFLGAILPGSPAAMTIAPDTVLVDEEYLDELHERLPERFAILIRHELHHALKQAPRYGRAWLFVYIAAFFKAGHHNDFETDARVQSGEWDEPRQW